MADPHLVKFYPVGNGDTAQIILNGGRRVLFDFCHRAKSEDDDTPEIDLKATLKKELKDADRDNFDVVAFTHADDDHIAGSTEFFELDHAAIYKGNGRIKIRELWVPAAMLLEKVEQGDGKEEFALWKKEARHRVLENRGIKVFSKPQELRDWLEPALKARGEAPNARDHLFVDAGTLVPGFSLPMDQVEFFCHSPFIKHCDEGDIVRNDASLVFNVRFQIDGYKFDFLQVGDSTASVLEDIVSITKTHGNLDRLNWNLYNLPHHCSYKALNEDEKGDDETVPTPLVKELLLLGKEESYLVSSSCPIPDISSSYDEVQPPHIQARKCYESHLEQVNGRQFLVTMEEPNANHPEPLVFEIAGDGVRWKEAVSAGAFSILSSSPPRAG